MELYNSGSPPPLSKPKTPLIAGIICAVCILLAWSISFFNWLLKRHRRHLARKQRRERTSRLSASESNADRAPRAKSPKFKLSVQDGDGNARPRLAAQNSDSSDDVQVAGNGNGNTNGHGGHVPSWVPESSWSRPIRPADDSSSSSGSGESLNSTALIPGTPLRPEDRGHVIHGEEDGGGYLLPRPLKAPFRNPSTTALPPTPNRDGPRLSLGAETSPSTKATNSVHQHEEADEEIAHTLLGVSGHRK